MKHLKRLLSPNLFAVNVCGRQILKMMSARNYNNVVEWNCPPWAQKLSNIPTHKVQLCHGNTPIHRWHLPGVPDDFQVYIKRDDMTGSTLSGNKVRKLEFIMADAVRHGCKHIITCGGIQSNHCRAVTTVAAQMGMKCHLVLRADIKSVDEVGCSGNILLNRLMGAHMYFVPKGAKYATELLPRMQAIAAKIRQETGEMARVMEVGGSDSVGFYGYLSAFDELIAQGVQEEFDDIIFACGSGGTAEGLAMANHLTGNKSCIHGVAVCDDAAYFHSHADNIFSQIGLEDVKAAKILDIVEGYKGQGYGISTQQELDFVCEVARSTGIVLDPTYTGKAARGLVEECRSNPDRFKGKRLLFIHTGGMFGAFDGKLNSTIMQRDQCHLWMEQSSPPF